MTLTTHGTVTALIDRTRLGDLVAQDELFQLLVDRLERQAQAMLRQDRMRHSMSADDLVQESIRRIIQDEVIQDSMNRSFLYKCAATRMRRVLIDLARSHQAAINGGEQVIVQSTDLVERAESAWGFLVDLQDAMEALNADERRAIELRFFKRMTIQESADAMGVGHAKVERDVRRARAKLRTILAEDSNNGS